MEKILKEEQKQLAFWAAECASRVISYFEEKYPNDNMPKKAIEACRAWICGKIKVGEMRKLALECHAAVRKAKDDGNLAACYAARAAGHAVAIAHVVEHAFGPSYYTFKVIEEINKHDKEKIKSEIKREFEWQLKHLPKNLHEKWEKWRRERLPGRLKLIIKG